MPATGISITIFRLGAALSTHSAWLPCNTRHFPHAALAAQFTVMRVIRSKYTVITVLYRLNLCQTNYIACTGKQLELTCMKQQLADRIRLARRAAGLSQSKAADLLYVHRGTFGHWERGAGHLPSSANLLQLAHVLGVSNEWLAAGRGSMQASVQEEVTAVRLDCFARSMEEEQLLLAFRELTTDMQAKVVDFAKSVAYQSVSTVAMLSAAAPASANLHSTLSHLQTRVGNG